MKPIAGRRPWEKDLGAGRSFWLLLRVGHRFEGVPKGSGQGSRVTTTITFFRPPLHYRNRDQAASRPNNSSHVREPVVLGTKRSPASAGRHNCVVPTGLAAISHQLQTASLDRACSRGPSAHVPTSRSEHSVKSRTRAKARDYMLGIASSRACLNR